MKTFILHLLFAPLLLLFGVPVQHAESPAIPADLAHKAEVRDYVERLQMKESNGDAGIVVLDSNGKNSYSCMQFQMSTWIGEGKKYNIETTPENIMDCELQKELAETMIADDPANAGHWALSVKKLAKQNVEPPALQAISEEPMEQTKCYKNPKMLSIAKSAAELAKNNGKTPPPVYDMCEGMIVADDQVI